MVKNFNQIQQDLQKEKLAPVYFLMGEEPYYIDEITNYIEKNALSDDQKEFNQTILYGEDTDIQTIDHAARRYPMMAQYQVLIVKEAQHIKKLDELRHYCQNPSPYTILVISYKYKKLNKNTKLFRVLKEKAVILESQKLYENNIPEWITHYLKDYEFEISPKATVLLTEFLGNDLSKIANELNKLIIPLEKGTTITPEHIEKNIGISKDFNNFELQDAIGARDVLKANRIVDYFGKNKKENPPTLTVISLYFFFSKILLLKTLKDKSPKIIASKLKISPYFVDKHKLASRNYSGKKVVEIISLLREYDLKIKGVDNASIPEEELLRELIYKILH